MGEGVLTDSPHWPQTCYLPASAFMYCDCGYVTPSLVWQLTVYISAATKEYQGLQSLHPANQSQLGPNEHTAEQATSVVSPLTGRGLHRSLRVSLDYDSRSLMPLTPSTL